MITCPIEVSIPLPTAIIMLNPGTNIQASSPIIKHMMPEIYNFFVEIFFTRNAVNGITIPIASEYPLVIHWPVIVLIPKYSTIGGSAIVIAVASIDVAIPVIIKLIKMSSFCLSFSFTDILLFVFLFFVLYGCTDFRKIGIIDSLPPLYCYHC